MSENENTTKNCWEIVNCDMKIRKKCPAYPDKGNICWKITGTKCDAGKMRKASLREKLEFCRQCEFYIKDASKV